jgi:hypothetical protein
VLGVVEGDGFTALGDAPLRPITTAAPTIAMMRTIVPTTGMVEDRRDLRPSVLVVALPSFGFSFISLPPSDPCRTLIGVQVHVKSGEIRHAGEK